MEFLMISQKYANRKKLGIACSRARMIPRVVLGQEVSTTLGLDNLQFIEVAGRIGAI